MKPHFQPFTMVHLSCYGNGSGNVAYDAVAILVAHRNDTLLMHDCQESAIGQLHLHSNFKSYGNVYLH